MGLSKLLFGFKKSSNAGKKTFKQIDRLHRQNQRQIKSGWMQEKGKSPEVKTMQKDVARYTQQMKEDAKPKFSDREAKSLEKDTQKFQKMTDKQFKDISLTKSSTFEQDALKKQTDMYEKDMKKTGELFAKNPEEPKQDATPEKWE